MLNLLKDANTYLGKMMPAELYSLTPKEYEYMMIGAQQRQLDRRREAFDLKHVTSPSILVDKNPNDETFKKILNEQENRLKNFDNQQFQKMEADKAKRKKQFNLVFGSFMRKGG